MIRNEYRLSREDSDAVVAIVPHQLMTEIIRSGSCALISDALRALTVAWTDKRLSDTAYATMIGVYADVLCEGPFQ